MKRNLRNVEECVGREIEDILSENIRKYRKQIGLTQAELAEKLGVDKNVFQRWENGTFPKLNNIKSIAEELKIDQGKLFLDEELIDPVVALEVLRKHFLSN